MPRENTPTSSNHKPEGESRAHEVACFDPQRPAQPCPICDGLGVIHYDVPLDDPRFGRLFRCPNNPPEQDTARQERLRRLGNLDAFADKTFENFVITQPGYEPRDEQSLQHAYNVALNFAQRPQGWLLLEGTYGCGKTHLAAAIGNIRLAQGDIVLFITTPDLLDHLRGTYAPGADTGYDELFDRVRDVPLLILDDLGVENPSPWAREKLFQLLNHRYSHMRPTVITTNSSLEDIDQRLRSRLLDTEKVSHIRISAPDYRTAAGRSDDMFSNLSLYADMSFDNFDTSTGLVSEERQKLENVLRIAHAYAQEPQGWLVLSGPYASGKTHLAAAIAHRRRSLGDEVIFVTVPDLLDYLRSAYDPAVNVRFDRRFELIRSVGLLVLDDLSTENAKAWAREKLFQILDHRHLSRRPTVITTARRIEEIDERLRSRLLDKRRSRIAVIQAPAYPLRTNRKSV